MSTRVFLAQAAFVTLGLLAAGCGGSSSSTGADDGREIQSVSLTLTDAGCDPAAMEVASGPVTFQVENKGASGVTELEVIKGKRILGEVENLADGLSGEFTLTLQPGTYELYCPNGKTAERGTLTVSGEMVAAASNAAADKAVADYGAYVISEAALLQRRTKAFTNAIRSGRPATARSLFAIAREPYERIEPVAESFGDLDPEIDARAGDVPAASWTGFHRLERMLWVSRATTAAMTPLADKLDKDVARLVRLVRTADYQPAQVANGAKELMDEIGASKVTGEEDRYSHTDLYDFQANVEGARAVYDAIAPLLVQRAPTLDATIEKEFANVERVLAPHRRGAGWVSYTLANVRASERRVLSRAVDGLAEPLSKMSAIVAR